MLLFYFSMISSLVASNEVKKAKSWKNYWPWMSVQMELKLESFKNIIVVLFLAHNKKLGLVFTVVADSSQWWTVIGLFIISCCSPIKKKKVFWVPNNSYMIVYFEQCFEKPNINRFFFMFLAYDMKEVEIFFLHFIMNE